MEKTPAKIGVGVLVILVAIAAVAAGFVLEYIRWTRQVQHNQAGVGVNQVKQGVLMYAADHDGRLPPMGDAQAFRQALQPYVKADSPFYRFPDKTVLNLPNPNLSFRRLADLKQPTVLLYESAPARVDNARWVAFYPEGTVPTPFGGDRDFVGLKLVGESEWRKLKQSHQLP